MHGLFKWAMTEAERKQWEVLRKRGPVFYVLVWGLLACGGGALAIDVCWNVLAGHKNLLSPVPAYLMVGAVVAGLLAGLFTWNSQEQRYRKVKAQESLVNDR